MRKCLITCLLLFLAVPLWSQREYPMTDSLVNDYSGMLTWRQRDSLEQRLRTFNDSTSNQIVIIITPRLYDEEIIDLAVRLGHEWGVGQKELDNGVIILIKSKCEEESFGDAAIVTGLGLEGVLPDAFCRRIIDDQMIPHLADTDYFSALTAALDIIEPVLAGEYSYAQYRKDERRKGLIALGVFVLFIVVVIVVLGIYVKKHPDSWNHTGSNLGGSGGAFIGGFPSGRSGGGFSGGGFGGFGGGSFGGGGASGRF
ncbi:MAG: TPM domain-containing protein [Bacteroidales bacterium]|nr:TPM domain-containing protein [Bacteroidales bacterium]